MYEKSTDGLQGRSCYNTGLFYMRFRMCSLGEQKPVWRERVEGQKGGDVMAYRMDPSRCPQRSGGLKLHLQIPFKL